MVLTRLLFFAVATIAVVEAAEAFHFPVFRAKSLRDERGRLEISESGVLYESKDGKKAIRLPFLDIHKADVSDPKAIRLETYDIRKRRLTGRNVHVFRLDGATHGQDLRRFLVEKLNRPVVGAYATAAVPVFEIPAYHRHRLGGCHGTIEIGPETIRFVSQKEADSGTWRYDEMETIGSMNPFHFRVTTLAETYNFDLKERLAEDAYQFAWQRVHELGPEQPTQTRANASE